MSNTSFSIASIDFPCICLSLSNAIFLNLSIGLLSFKKYTNSYTPFDPCTFCSIGSEKKQRSESKRTYFLQESQDYYIPAFWQPNLAEESPFFVNRQMITLKIAELPALRTHFSKKP